MGAWCGKVENTDGCCRNRDGLDEEFPNLVVANIYDLNEHARTANAFIHDALNMGGVFHAGIQVFGAEWSYGQRGVYSIPPRRNPHHEYRQSIVLGQTDLDMHDWAAIIHEQTMVWRDFDYDPLKNNCIDFVITMSELLGVSSLPDWVGSLAKTGASIEENLEKVVELRWRACSFVGHKIDNIPSLDKIMNSMLEPCVAVAPSPVSRGTAETYGTLRSTRLSLGILPKDAVFNPRRANAYSPYVESKVSPSDGLQLNQLVYPFVTHDGFGYALEVPRKSAIEADGDEENTDLYLKSSEYLREDDAILVLQKEGAGQKRKTVVFSLQQHEDSNQGVYRYPAPAMIVQDSPYDLGSSGQYFIDVLGGATSTSPQKTITA